MPTVDEPTQPPPADPVDPGAADAAAPDPADTFKAAAGNLGEAGAYALQYVSVQLDKTIATVRNLALLVVLGIVAGVVGLSVMVTSAVLLVVGLAQAVAAALSSQPGVGAAWPGNLIVGGVLCLLTVGGTWLVTKWIKSAAFAATVRKYEKMQEAQKQVLGHTAGERAEEKLKAKMNPDPSHAPSNQ